MSIEPEPAIEPLEAVSDPVDTARRKHGSAGAILAAGMFGVDIALGRKPKQDAPVVVSSNSEPVDIDADGIRIPIDENVHVVAPPLPPSQPIAPAPKRSRR
jgi:hypothetical protein